MPRKQRNQPASRAQDLDFAAEITTSLIDQVKQLQAALLEREDALKSVNSDKARLEHEAAGFSLRLKSLDESEQRYKEENWNLETQTHEMIAAAKEAANREQKLQQTLAAATAEKDTAQRELDDLRQSHGKLAEDHDTIRKSHESELAGLRKNINLGDSERGALQRKVEELTSQNLELAKAVEGRLRMAEGEPREEAISELENPALDLSESDHSPPPSPSKGIHRHSLLETETLKSSLHHAHRMIQNLKSNVQREKTEKLDLKRMLQEARDELDVKSRAGNDNKRPKTKSQQDLPKKITRPNMLGTNRNSKTDILVDDQDWEDGDGSPSYTAGILYRDREASNRAVQPTPASDGYHTANDTEDGFETAAERNTTTDTDDFQTGAESMAGESSDELTETEGAMKRDGTIRERRPAPLAAAKAGDRSSFRSTASTSADEGDYEMGTPLQAQPQRYRLKINRGSRRSRLGSEPVEGNSPSTAKNSPASFIGNGVQGGQTLFNELDNLSDDGADGTPSRSGRSHRSTPSMNESIRSNRSSSSKRRSVSSHRSTPANRPTTVIYGGAPAEQPPVPRLPLVDSSMMTEPWEPVPAPVNAASTETTVPSTPLSKGTHGPPKVESDTDPASRSVSTSPRTIWDQPLQMFSGIIPTFGSASHKSTPLSTRSNVSREVIKPEVPDSSPAVHRYPGAYEPSESGEGSESPDFDGISQRSLSTRPQSIPNPPTLSFSSIQSLDTIPTLPPVIAPPPSAQSGADLTTSVPSAELGLPSDLPRDPVAGSQPPLMSAQKRSEDFEDASSEFLQPPSQKAGSALGNSWAHPNGLGGILGSVFGGKKSDRSKSPPIMEDETSQNFQPLPSSSTNKDVKSPLGEVAENTVLRDPYREQTNLTKADAPLVSMADEASQTVLSADQIDSMLKEKENALPLETKPPAKKAMKPLSDIGAMSTPAPSIKFESGDLARGKVREPTGMPMEGVSRDIPTLTKSPRRPISAASIRQRTDQYPPLPPDHQKAIAAAAQKQPEPPTGVMGPPLAPASSYRNRVRTPSRPRTPSEQRAAQSPSSKGGTTPRAGYSTTKSQVSRRTSVSSFVSEIDERFNIRADAMPMPGMDPGTDPRMIQAITQTMIGEFLWKYTRKAGRGDMSSNRHRRFFWVHPYTRTLYWSDYDPATAGRAQLKAKSVAIEAVRVVTDDNPMPPGLHRKSLVIMTPGRAVKLTATTGQRHETWFNALSYLLLRTGPDGSAQNDGNITAEDIAEFNPSHKNRGSSHSRLSLASWRSRRTSDANLQHSYNSRQTPATQPSSRQQPQSVAQRASTSNMRAAQTQPQPQPGTARSRSRIGSVSSRISEYWKPSGSARGSISSRHSRSSMQQARAGSVNDVPAHDSAEDLRRVIEHAEREGGVENVRACCDGMSIFSYIPLSTIIVESVQVFKASTDKFIQ